MKMKKFFLSTLYFVTFSLLFASCDSNAPENKSFDIQITEIGSNVVKATITPSNDNMEWTYSIFLTADARELGFKGYIIEDFRKEGFTYAKLSQWQVIYHGKQEITVPFPSAAGANYTLCIFNVDKELNIISDVFSRSFYTSSTGYIDLGLPSGKLWSKEKPCASVNYASIPSEYVKYLPTKAEWQELIDNCDFKWDAISKSFYAKGRNGKNIWLDRTVAGENKAYYWSCTGYDITNTYRWVLVLEEDKAPEFTTMPNFAAVGVMQVIPSPNSVQ